MKVIADVCIIPIGVETSVSQYVQVCQKIFQEFNLKTNIHAYGTNLEGDWDTINQAIKRCHEVLHDMGVPRLSTSIKVGSRIDKPQTLEDKIRKAEFAESAPKHH